MIKSFIRKSILIAFKVVVCLLILWNSILLLPFFFYWTYFFKWNKIFEWRPDLKQTKYKKSNIHSSKFSTWWLLNFSIGIAISFIAIFCDFECRWSYVNNKLKKKTTFYKNLLNIFFYCYDLCWIKIISIIWENQLFQIMDLRSIRGVL